ncbi:hypothetical protein Tco_1271688 [Tanacetum coccineum]
MSTLQFAETHNMIAFLEKPAESNGFQEIINFLNANQIYYALTVNPTIYTSCIELFWGTVKAKMVNGERQLQALVDKKKVIITETSIKSDLHLEDAGGTDCLPTVTIFEELARMGYEKPSQRLTFYKAFFSPQWKFLIHTITQCLSAKTTAWNKFSSTMASAIIRLATNQKFNLSKYIFDVMVLDLEKAKDAQVKEIAEISGKKDESSSKKAKIAQDSSAKRAGDKLESDKSKKQKTDENEEVEVDNEAELKKHMVTVKDDDIAIDAIPLATKPPVIVEYKLIREGIMGHYQLIRADGSFKRYSSMIRMLQGIDREDLQTLWKLVKTKHGDTRPEDEHERVLWGDLKVMFEPDIKSDVWRNLQGYKVTVWKLFDSCGVHFVRFGNVHIFMLVEKRYPLTPITITNMLNKKLQADYWNEMCYQLLKLMVKQQKGQ